MWPEISRSDDRPARGNRSRFAALPTSVKMFAILTMALLPLGLMALFASMRSAQNNRLQHQAVIRTDARLEAAEIERLLAREAAALRRVLDSEPETRVECVARLNAIRAASAATNPTAYALYDADGHRMCASPGYAVRGVPPPRGRLQLELLLLGDPAGLRFTVPASRGAGYGVGEIPAPVLRRLVAAVGGQRGAVLSQGSTRLTLVGVEPPGPLDQRLAEESPVARQMALTIVANVRAISAAEALLILLPLLMWLAAAVIGWVVVDRLLLRPLAEVQRAVSAWRSGAAQLTIPKLTTPAREIRDLAEAIAATAGALGRHEAQLELGLARQTKLTREVHHRVKNNLQVVASLINLHARGAADDVARAYASIQRRVDALAVVHRNHYAELEEQHGLDIRALIGELTANLRATAPAEASRLGVELDLISASVGQDVAVPVAFLVTEVVELAMTCDPAAAVRISLRQAEEPGRARLAIASATLAAPSCRAHPMAARFERIVQGLSRQLRSRLEFDADTGCYAIVIPVHRG